MRALHEEQNSNRAQRRAAVCRPIGLVVLVLTLAMGPLAADTFYVSNSHSNASDGNQYHCGSRTSCTEENRIAQGYGTRDQPFGSISEGVHQVDTYGPTGVDTIYVAPGLYREQVYTANLTDIEIIGDRLGEHTGSIPGEVIITGSEPLDESGFVEFDPVNYPGIYKLTDARRPDDGRSICLTQNDYPAGTTCGIPALVEVGDPEQDRIRYSRFQSLAITALAPGRFWADIRTGPTGDPEVDLYVNTLDGDPPTEAMQLEYILFTLVSDLSYDVTYRHKHCIDLEGRPENVLIEGFTCRFTYSHGFQVRAGNNTVRDNLLYGIRFGAVSVSHITPLGPDVTRVVGNEISHSNIGVHVEKRAGDVYIENNVLHANRLEGVRITPAAGGSSSATVYLGNNTLHGNRTNLIANGDGDLIAVNNSFSDPTNENCVLNLQLDPVATDENSRMSFNNVIGEPQSSCVGLQGSNQTSHAPGYRNPASFDFHLTETSLLRDAGTSLAVGAYVPATLDGDGAPRVEPHDVGAFEFSYCGDGIVDSGIGEQCDDGGRRDGDGCDASCQIETGYVFQGQAHATDSSCDCLYTIDNEGAKTLVADFPPGLTTPTNMATLDGDVYVVDNTTRSLYRVDTGDGTTDLLCSGLPVIHGLGINPVASGGWPAGTVFASRTHLYVIDPIGCSVQDLGAIGPAGNETIAGLDFRSDGALFGAQLAPFGQSESLFEIDPATGAGTIIGTIGPGFDRVGSLVFDGNDVLWVSDISSLSPRLVRLDPGDASIIEEIDVDVLFSGQPWNPQGLDLVQP